MTMAAQAVRPVDFYAQARVEFEALLKHVSESPTTSHVTLGKTITDGIRRVGGKAYQARLDELFERERAEVPNWTRPEGCEVRARSRGLETELGRMTVRRHGVKLAGEAAAHFPMDEALELPAELYALTLREQVALDAMDVSFERTVARVDRTTSGHVPKRQAEELVVRASADFDTFYKERTPPANDTLSPNGLEVMSVDCKGVTMRPEALREATRKEAEAAKADTVRGDPMAARKLRRADKRMAVVTAVWEQELHKRKAEDVVERLGRDRKGRARTRRSDKAPRPQNKRVAASVDKSHAQGVAAMFDEAQRRNPDGARRNIVLVDGDEHQIDAVEAEAKRRGMRITIVLDLIHAIHYLWLIAMLLCAADTKAAEACTAHILLQLLTKHPLDVIATIRQTATNRRLTGAERNALDKAVDYLRKNSTRIHYARFLREGLPIATGVIEGACRHLIQDRLGITGARWGLEVAEAVLKLRAIQSSGDWDEYWQFHLKREHARNYPAAKNAA